MNNNTLGYFQKKMKCSVIRYACYCLTKKYSITSLFQKSFSVLLHTWKTTKKIVKKGGRTENLYQKFLTPTIKPCLFQKVIIRWLTCWTPPLGLRRLEGINSTWNATSGLKIMMTVAKYLRFRSQQSNAIEQNLNIRI